jgi:hypothetical protein
VRDESYRSHGAATERYVDGRSSNWLAQIEGFRILGEGERLVCPLGSEAAVAGKATTGIEPV